MKLGSDPLFADDWIERTLRADGVEHAAAHIDDAGFTARVMAELPAAVALPRWRKPFVTAIWILAGAGTALALPEVAVEVGREAFRLLSSPVSLPHIAAMLALMGFTTFGAAAYALKRD